MASAQALKTEIDRRSRQCLAVRVRLLNRVITNLYDEALRPLRVKASQMNILVATGKLGLAQPGKVCELLQLDTSTLSRNVDRMRARGWIEVVGATDGRAHPFRLTAAGQKLLHKSAPLWEVAQRKAGKLLGREGVAWLTASAGQFGF